MWCNRDGFASTAEGPEWPLISERKVVNTSWFYDFHSVGLFPLTPPSPLGRGRIVRRACANPERLDSSRRGMRCSLSQREGQGEGEGDAANQKQPNQFRKLNLNRPWLHRPGPSCG